MNSAYIQCSYLFYIANSPSTKDSPINVFSFKKPFLCDWGGEEEGGSEEGQAGGHAT